MMTLLLPLLTPAAEAAPAPPLRADLRGVIREGTLGTALFEVGVQLARSKRFAVDLNLGVAPPATLLLPDPPRSMGFLQLSSDLLWEPNLRISVGPSLTLDLRGYSQQQTFFDYSVVPTGGLRANVHLLRAPRWSLALTTKVMIDFVTTELLTESGDPMTLSPFSAQVGLRFHFGHGQLHSASREGI